MSRTSPLRPCIGRTVHFHTGLTVNPGSTELKANAATIADVLDDTGKVNLMVVLHNGLVVVERDVSLSPEPKEGCWSWPPRV